MGLRDAAEDSRRECEAYKLHEMARGGGIDSGVLSGLANKAGYNGAQLANLLASMPKKAGQAKRKNRKVRK